MEKKKSLFWRLFWFLGKIIGLLLLVKFIKDRMKKEEKIEPKEFGALPEEPAVEEPVEDKEK